jgi:hypothetical protein
MAEHAKHAKGSISRSRLLQDLTRRGMLDDTLDVWTPGLGRTPGVGRPTRPRPHHSAALLMAGRRRGKRRPHLRLTDDIGATVAENKVHVHDFHATILHLLGLDHTKLPTATAAATIGSLMCTKRRARSFDLIQHSAASDRATIHWRVKATAGVERLA